MSGSYAAWRNGVLTGFSLAGLTLHERGPERCLIRAHTEGSGDLRLDTEGRLHAFGHTSQPIPLGVAVHVHASVKGIEVTEETP